MNIIVSLLLAAGLFFYTGGLIGILRFPDFYSRLHPAGKLDTLGLMLSMTSLGLYNLYDFSLGTLINGFKMLLIMVFVFLASPTATHAIVDAGVRAGLAPWAKGDARR
jgi:multicomponent Na+:H+ antiporter subunit G